MCTIVSDWEFIQFNPAFPQAIVKLREVTRLTRESAGQENSLLDCHCFSLYHAAFPIITMEGIRSGHSLTPISRLTFFLSFHHRTLAFLGWPQQNKRAAKLFKKQSKWKYNLHTIKFTHFKYINSFQYIYRAVKLSLQPNFRINSES